MIDIVKLGNEIRKLRKKMGITQEELAEKLNVRFQAVSNWERGKAPPSIDNLVEISEFFGVSVDSIIKPSDEECYISAYADDVKTEFVLFTIDGKVRRREVLPMCNPHEIGMSSCKKILIEGLEKLLSDAVNVKAAFLGLAGFGVSSTNEEMSSYLHQSVNITNIMIDSDVYNMFALGDVDIVLLAETDIILITKNDKKSFGGWGNTFQDLGSKYAIGREVLRACMLYEDGIGKNTSIYPRILKKLLDNKKTNVDFTLREQTEKIYLLGKKFVISIFPIVIEEYLAGDQVAIEIIEKNVKYIAALLNRAIEYSKSKKVIAKCSLISDNKKLILPLLKKYTSANLIFSDLPPIFGACRVCLQREGVIESGIFEENFRKTYELLL